MAVTKKEVGTCPFCSAKMVEYKHSINAMVIDALRRLSDAGGVANISQIGLTSNQRNNFQKLRYWDLVEKHHDKDGERVGGWWKITRKGIGFLCGAILIQKYVWTYRNERVRYDGVLVDPGDYLDKKYWMRDDYIKNSKPKVLEV